MKETRYSVYKASGVEWLGEIPEHWGSIRIKNACIINENSLPESTSKTFDFEYVDIGSVSFEHGVFQSEKFNFKNAPSRARRLAKSGDVIVSTVRTYLKAIDYINEVNADKIFSTGFAVLNPVKIDSKYLLHCIRNDSFTYQVDEIAKGMSYPAINTTDLGSLHILIPPLSEQKAIAEFLDQKTALIDQAIRIKDKQITLLKERRQILIHQAVTRGLDPTVKLKDSGVEWIGEIPEGWEVKRCKYLFYEVTERSIDGKEELLSVSHMTGVTPRSEKNVSMFMSEDYSGSKLCQKEDLIYNIMWAWMGALGVANQSGIVSPSYGVYRQLNSDSLNIQFIDYKLKTSGYIEYHNKVSTGLHSSRLRFYAHMFMNMEIDFPEIDIQNKIVEYINTGCQKIEAAISLKMREIEKLKEYKATLINGAVTGIIKVMGT